MSTEANAAPEPVRVLLEESGATSLPENAPADAVAAVCLKVEALARAIGAVLRAAVREALIREFGRAGVRSPAKMADAALGSPEEKADAQARGTALEWADPEPSPDPVDGAELLDALADLLLRYVRLPDHAATVLALWIVHTWCLEAADTTPYIHVCSATKRCGKSRLLEILREIARRPLPTASISEAGLFRAIEEWQPTLLIDEADGILDIKPELRAVVNDGYRRGGGAVRCVGEDHEVRKFSTYCPKVIALIGATPTTTRDRGVVIRMRRRRRDEPVARMRLAALRREVGPLLARLARFSADSLAALEAAEPPVPEPLDDRAADFWHPLLAIADRAGDGWATRSRVAAVALSGERDAEEDEAEMGVLLLRDIATVFHRREADRISSERLAGALMQIDERPWEHYGKREEPIKPREIARLLRPFGVNPRSMRVPERVWNEKAKAQVDEDVVKRGYALADFLDVFARYNIPAPSATPLQEGQNPPGNGAGGVADGPGQDAPGGGSATAGSGSGGPESAGCSGVADDPPGTTEGKSTEAAPPPGPDKDDSSGRCQDCGTPIPEETARQFGGVCWNCRQNRGFREAGR